MKRGESKKTDKKRLMDKHKILIISFLVNVAIFTVLLCFFEPRFDTNDDMAMSNIVDGSKGIYDYHLIFINCVIGYILKWLYMTFAVIPWYSVLQYVIIFPSLTVLTFVMLERIRAPYCRCVLGVCLIVIAYEEYIWIQFSRTAAIATAAGVILLLSIFFHEKFSWKRLIVGYILALFGSFYRFEQFLVVTALLSGIGLFFLLRLIRKKNWKKKLIQCISVFAVLFVFVMGFHRWDQGQYVTEEWEEYKQFNYLRAQLYDYGFPSYEENSYEYHQLGIDDTANTLFLRHVTLDPDRITVDNLGKLVDLKETKPLDGEFCWGFCCALFFNVYQIPAFFLALYAGIVWLFYNKRCWRETVTIIYETLLIIMIYLYLYWEGRYYLNRVDMGLWMAVAMVILWLLTQENKAFSKRAGVVSALILVFVGLYIAYPQFRVNTEDGYERKMWYQEQFQEMNEDNGHLYMLKVKALNVDWTYGPFDRLPDGVLDNLCPLGGWTSRSASDNAILQRYGVENPFREIINSDTIYLLDDDIEPTLAYIRKWYAWDAKAKMVTTIGDCPVYQIVSKKRNN